VGEQKLADAVRAVAWLPRAKALVLAGALMGGEIETAVREVRQAGLLVLKTRYDKNGKASCPAGRLSWPGSAADTRRNGGTNLDCCGLRCASWRNSGGVWVARASGMRVLLDAYLLLQ
jgi:hypothetical protein